MNRKALIAVLVAIIMFGGYGLYRSGTLDSIVDESDSTPLYSQSGEVTAVEANLIKMSYATFIDVDGVRSSVHKELVLSVSDSIPVSRIMSVGEEFREVSGAIADIKAGSKVVVYMSPEDKGKDTVRPIKIDILE